MASEGIARYAIWGSRDYERLNAFNRQMGKNITVNRQKRNIFYRQPSNANISLEINLERNDWLPGLKFNRWSFIYITKLH